MNLSEVNRGIEKHKEPRRLGRGIGSGQGKTAGRGRCRWCDAFPSAGSTTSSP
jgi:hypothetical protein